MATTPSTMLALGTPAPDFALPDTEGRTVTRDQFAGRPLLVLFICNHCPYVKHVAPALAAIGREYVVKGVGVVAISSNDAVAYPADAPEKMAEERAARGYVFPYLYDETQAVARGYTAACTPDVFLFDAKHRLYYRGQIDDTRPTRHGPGNYSSENRATGKDLRAALDAVLAGDPAPAEQRPSVGCGIKWKGERE